jgi:hypothetical protein
MPAQQPDSALTLFEVPEHFWQRRQCPVCGGALSVTYGHTYVVQRQGWVKIGATNNPRRRVNELARPAWSKHLLSPVGMDWHEPLLVLAVLDGDREHHLHQQFGDFHVLGEWFLPSGSLLEWIADTVGGGPRA